jgi:predicted enzyme related to lactoylglutathione lyase
MKTFFLTLIVIAVISLGFTAESADDKSANVSNNKDSSAMTNKKVTGVGGIFFKCKDPANMRDWYSKNLGLVTNEYGSLFEFRLSDKPEEKAYLQWSPFPEKTEYFKPSEKDFMINYRVENLESLLEELKSSGVTVLDTIETYEYGKFLHIMDPEGNKIELWETVKNSFTESYEGKTTK